MPPSLLAAVAASVFVALWLLGRRPRPLLTNTDTKEVAALNRQQNEQVAQFLRSRDPAIPGPVDPAPSVAFSAGGEVKSPAPASVAQRPSLAGGLAAGTSGGEAAGAGAGIVSLPATARQRIAFRTTLLAWAAGDATQRLRAMEAAGRWSHRDALPVLRRGLRDPDLAVMRAAARGMDSFRGRTSLPAPASQASARPRRVARTR